MGEAGALPAGAQTTDQGSSPKEARQRSAGNNTVVREGDGGERLGRLVCRQGGRRRHRVNAKIGCRRRNHGPTNVNELRFRRAQSGASK
jgi:hypothetical protein